MSACVRLWKCFKYDNSDITAWLKVCVARGPTTTVVSIFTATAIIFMATLLDTDCDEKVDLQIITLRTSSVLAAVQVVENVVNLILTPVFGAIADGSNHRKSLLLCFNIIWAGSLFLSGILLFFDVTLTLFWAFIILILLVSIFYELALMLLFSYLPEIAKDESELTNVSSRQYAIVNGVQLVVAGFLVGVTTAIEFDDDLPYAIIAHFLCTIMFLYYFIPGIIALPSRKASSTMKNPFTKLMATGKEVYNKYPHIGYFFLSWIFYFSGIISVTVLQVAYVSAEFGYGTEEVSYLGASLLIFAIIGAAATEKLSKIFKLKTILFGTVLGWTFLGIIAPFILRGQDLTEVENNTEVNAAGCLESEIIDREPREGADILAFLVSIFYGLGIGVIYPVNVAIYSLIVPGGEEATFFALKAFGAKVLAWAPPLVFAGINESTGNLQVAFMTLSLWFILALPFIYLMDVEQGMRDVEHTLALRRGPGNVADLYEKRESILEKEHRALSAVNPISEVASILDGNDHEKEKESLKPVQAILADEDVEIAENKDAVLEETQENNELNVQEAKAEVGKKEAEGEGDEKIVTEKVTPEEKPTNKDEKNLPEL